MQGHEGQTHWTSLVNQVLLDIINHDLSKAYFNAPPPGSTAGPGTGPVCFAFILQRIMDKGYASPAEVHTDIQRIWAQCRAMHPPGSEPVRAAEQLAPRVELLWRHVGLSPGPPPGGEHGPGPVQYMQAQPAQPQYMQQHAAQHTQQHAQQHAQYQPAAVSRPLSQQSLGTEHSSQMERPDQQMALLQHQQQQQQQQQMLMAQQQRQSQALRAHSPYLNGAGLGAQLGSGGGFGSGPFAGVGGMGGAVGGSASMQLGLGSHPGGGMPLDPMASGSLRSGSLDALQHQHQHQQQQQLAEERARLQQRRLALLRLRAEMSAQGGGLSHLSMGMGGAGGPASTGLLGDMSALGGAGLGMGSGHSLHSMGSLAEQQQQMLHAMASGQAPPRVHADHGGPPTGQRPLQAMGPGDSVALSGAQQAQQGLGDPAAMHEHERQRQRLALLKRDMLMSLQQQQQMFSQHQQAAQHIPGGLGMGQLQGGPDRMQLAGMQAQQAQQQAQLQASLHRLQSVQQSDVGSLLSPGSSQLLASPTASFGGGGGGGGGRRQARKARGTGQAGLTGKRKDSARSAGWTAALSDGSLRQGHPLYRCLLVLQRLLQHEDAEPFAEPVDAEGLGLSDYHQVIRRPMDLGTIHNRLAPGLTDGWGMIAYKSTDEVLLDVQLVWANCRRYNAEGSPITDMCGRLERAFSQLWEAAGLGSTAAAVARPHVMSPPPPVQQGRAEQRGKQPSRQAQGRPPPKQGRGQTAKQSLAQLLGHTDSGQHASAHTLGGPGSPGSSKRARSDAAASLAPEPLLAQLQPELGGGAPLAAAQLQEAEVAEEAAELQRLLSTSGSSPRADLIGAAAAAAAAAGGSASPMLWEAPLPGGLEPEAVAARAPSRLLSGAAAASDPFATEWQAAGPSGPSVPNVLLHPDRDARRQGSLPPTALMTQPPSPAAAVPQTGREPALPTPPQPDTQVPAALSGLAAATASVTPKQLQREQAVLAAWQQVQAQRQAALQAMEAAEVAAQELAAARVELEAAQAAEAAAASHSQRQQAARGVSSRLTNHQARQPGSAAGAASEAAPVAVPRSSDELVALAAAARQARLSKLHQLGMQLFGRPTAGATATAGTGGGCSSGSTQMHAPGSAGASAAHDCSPSPAACAVAGSPCRVPPAAVMTVEA